MWSPALLLLSIAGIVFAQQKLWENCGEQSGTGATKCIRGASCVSRYQNEKDSRCLPGECSEVKVPTKSNAKHQMQIQRVLCSLSRQLLLQLKLLNTSRYAVPLQRDPLILPVMAPSLGTAKPSTSMAKRTR
jgi:hypothetical protein